MVFYHEVAWLAAAGTGVFRRYVKSCRMIIAILTIATTTGGGDDSCNYNAYEYGRDNDNVQVIVR